MAVLKFEPDKLLGNNARAFCTAAVDVVVGTAISTVGTSGVGILGRFLSAAPGKSPFRLVFESKQI